MISLMIRIKTKINQTSLFYPQLTIVTLPHPKKYSNHHSLKSIHMLISHLEANLPWIMMISKSKFLIKSLKKKFNLNNNQKWNNKNQHKTLVKTRLKKVTITKTSILTIMKNSAFLNQQKNRTPQKAAKAKHKPQRLNCRRKYRIPMFPQRWNNNSPMITTSSFKIKTTKMMTLKMIIHRL